MKPWRFMKLSFLDLFSSDLRKRRGREIRRMSVNFNSILYFSNHEAALPVASCKARKLNFHRIRPRPETHLTELTALCTLSCYHHSWSSIRKNFRPAINTLAIAPVVPENIMQMMMLHHKSTWKQSRNQQETSSGSMATTSNFPHANKLLLRLARRRRISEMRWSIDQLAHKCVRCGFGSTQNISIQKRGYWVSFSLHLLFPSASFEQKRDFF